MIESLKSQFGRLDIQAGELEGRNARSAYFKTMFLAFREDGAKDWTSNLAISLSHGGKQHSLQFHHVFPRALVKGQHRPVVVNDIANLAFLGGRTNRKISNKEPEKYLPQVVAQQGTGALASQCIPTGDGLLKLDQFPAFLAERRRLIADRLNQFLDKARSTRRI